MDIKIIYGSDTGNTEDVTNMIVDLLMAGEGRYITKIVTVEDLEPEDWTSHDYYFLGIPTWYDGELQSCWEDYFDTFKTIDFTGKTVAIFGLGDQIGYEEWFCDGVGILAETIMKNGGQSIGWTDIDETYDLDEKPKSMYNEFSFYGLCLDEDNQPELTQDRLKKWIEKITYEQRDYKYKHLQ